MQTYTLGQKDSCAFQLLVPRTGYWGQGPITTVWTHISLITSADSGMGRKIPSVDSWPCQYNSSFMKCLLCVTHTTVNSGNIFEVVIKFSITFTLCGFVAYPFLMNFALTNNVVIAIMPHFYCSVVCQVFHNHGEESKCYLGNLSGMYFLCR